MATKSQRNIKTIQNTISNLRKGGYPHEKEHYSYILSIISAVLLIGSFPLKLIAESIVVDMCRLVGFALIFVVLGLRISPKDKSAKADGKGV